MSNLIFLGNAQVQLFGRNALIPLSLQYQSLTCSIGAENTELRITEHRKGTIEALISAAPNYPENFLEVFNTPARVEIRYTPLNEKVEIDLFDVSDGTTEIPILWFGVLEDNLMPGYEVEWEVLKSVDENNTAFCALVKTHSIISNNHISFVSVSEEDAEFSK